MKFKTTKKQMKDNYHYILGTGYCSLQHLLNYENEIAYSTRSEGWACDYYEIDGVLISTGYSPIASKNIKADYETIRKYNEQAQAIQYNYDLSWENRRDKVRELLHQFIKEIKQNANT